MHKLEERAPEVFREFSEGNFAVKMSKNRFNQVPVDQGTEWVNRICKVSNGIIGITRNDTTRDRFCTTWSERSHVSKCTRVMYHLDDEDDDSENISTRKEALPSRILTDEKSVQSLVKQFARFKVFNIQLEEDMSSAHDTVNLTALTTKDVATEEIQQDLLTAYDRGKEALMEEVNEKLINKSTDFYESTKRHKSKTIASLYNVHTQGKQNKGSES